MAVALVLLGYGHHIAGHFGVRGGLGTTGWKVLKWLLVLGFVLMAFNLLYIFAPKAVGR